MRFHHVQERLNDFIKMRKLKDQAGGCLLFVYSNHRCLQRQDKHLHPGVLSVTVAARTDINLEVSAFTEWNIKHFKCI